MVIQWSGSLLEATVYLLCVVTSLLCAYLLARAYRRGRTRLLVWSAICFGLLALNNLVLAVDVLLLPDLDLSIFRIFTVFLAVSAMLYGFIWEV
ncbi:MAG TPA: DUF5985 family protein [Acetobacteraceae bacterium]|jgi:hypothetical protein|nr:DUF5985 family protein [Acetobacteraceae bacterium]